MKTNFLLLLFLLLFANCNVDLSIKSEEDILRDACTYLWNQQSADGGWHSKTHGILKGGESITPFIFNVLLQIDESIFFPNPSQKEATLKFIKSRINEQGAMGKSDNEILDYPNYATAHALLVLRKVNNPDNDALINRITKYLLSQQFIEHRGFLENNPAYGSWGFGETNLTTTATGHVDLSHTRRIMEALKGLPNTKDALLKAKHYLDVVQKHPTKNNLHPTTNNSTTIPFDGGFFASPITLGTNKGGLESDILNVPHYFRSYSTATCDGILGLLALGFDVFEPQVDHAFQWLQQHPKWEYPEGIPLDDPDQWHEVMFYYHLMVRSEVYNQLSADNVWKKSLIQLLKSRQGIDGSFQNPMGGPNKEDDPYLATAFSILALKNALSN